MTTDLHHIVAATDFSQPAECAVRRAATLARELGVPLHLVHALEPADWLRRLGQVAASHFDVEARRRGAYQALDVQRQRLLAKGQGGLEVDLDVVDGPLHRCLHERASQGDRELLVIGATGQGGLRRVLLGSTADRVLRLGCQPVLLVRQPAGQAYTRVAFATDFSPASRKAASFAATLQPRAQHFLLHACSVPMIDSVAFTGMPDSEREAFRRENLAEAMGELAKAAEELAEHSPGLTLVPREGSPGPVIAQFVAEAGIELLTLGVTPRPRWEANLLGSTALFATSSVECDLLMVPALPGN